MLLSLRSLWETTAAVVVDAVTGATSGRRDIQRKLRRLARWSEAVSLPRIAIIIKGVAFPPLEPAIAVGTVVITRHVAVYNKGSAAAAVLLAGFKGVDVSTFALDDAIKSFASLETGGIEAKIDLLKEEITALAMLAA